MKLSRFYREAIAAGMTNDPRGKKFVQEELKRRKKEYESLSEADREHFDLASLTNPYSDSRIIVGTGEEAVTRVMVGIDIDTAEVLLCDRLNERGGEIDLILAHHPLGRAMAQLFGVMKMQADILEQFGVSVSAAESLLGLRIKAIQRRFMPVNHMKTADAAGLLNIPLMCTHTPADNMVTTFLQKLIDKAKPFALLDIVDLLLTVPEYQEARRNGAGPTIVLGGKKRRAGKVFVDMTGGTSGAKKLFQNIASSGVNTIVGMHISEEYRDEAKKHHLNVVIAGHISSDTIGMNLLLDAISKKSGKPLDVVACSGFRRFSRA